MSPQIIFVPGLWEGSAPYTAVNNILQAQGYETEFALLPSTGTTTPGNPSMADDIAAIRSVVERRVNEGKEVVLVLHSAGGFLGSNAIEGLTLQARKNKGLQGGVKVLVLLSAGLLPKGFMHGPLPFFSFENGAIHCVTPRHTLYNDLDEAEAENWVEKLMPQPAIGWDDRVTYCGWKDVPSVYLVCENDACLPMSMQLQWAESAGSKVIRCTAGHTPMVSMPEKVVEVIIEAAVG